MNALGSHRRHPAAVVILLMLGLVVTGGLYSFLAPRPAPGRMPLAGPGVQATRSDPPTKPGAKRPRQSTQVALRRS